MLAVPLLAAVRRGRHFRGLERRAGFDRVPGRGVLCKPLAGEAAARPCAALGHDTALLRGTVPFVPMVTAIMLVVLAPDGPAGSRLVRTDALSASGEVRDAARRPPERPGGPVVDPGPSGDDPRAQP